MKNLIAIILLIGSVFTGCERVVSIDVEEGPERLVVEGRIERHQDQTDVVQSIRLTTTDAFFSNARTPPANEAEVTVSDNVGNRYLFLESRGEPGLYQNEEIRPTVGRIYTLEILYRGELYRASEELLPVAPIDSIYQKFNKGNAFEDEGVRVKIDYQDVAGWVDYYLWEQFADGVSLAKPDPGNSLNFVGSDEFYDGQKIVGFEPNEEAPLKPGQLIEVRQIALSEQAFEFYFLLFQQTGQNSIFPVPAALIRGNVENTTNPAHYPLGYFGASEVDVAQLTIEEVGEP